MAIVLPRQAVLTRFTVRLPRRLLIIIGIGKDELQLPLLA